MKLTKKQLIIFAVILILILIIILFFIFFKTKKQVVAPINQQDQQSDVQLPVSGEDKDFDSISFEKESQLDVNSLILSTARNFIERYGSWSNQTDDFYELISPIITNSMYAQARDYLSKNENFQNKDAYYGITTKALSVKILESSSSSAKVSCSMQQIENKNDTEEIIYKTADLSLVYYNNKWLVDSVLWK